MQAMCVVFPCSSRSLYHASWQRQSVPVVYHSLCQMLKSLPCITCASALFWKQANCSNPIWICMKKYYLFILHLHNKFNIQDCYFYKKDRQRIEVSHVVFSKTSKSMNKTRFHWKGLLQQIANPLLLWKPKTRERRQQILNGGEIEIKTAELEHHPTKTLLTCSRRQLLPGNSLYFWSWPSRAGQHLFPTFIAIADCWMELTAHWLHRRKWVAP